MRESVEGRQSLLTHGRDLPGSGFGWFYQVYDSHGLPSEAFAGLALVAQTPGHVANRSGRAAKDD